MRMELGEPDASGRRRPVPIQGSEFDLPLSVAVIAIGTSANPMIQSTTPGLQTNKRGYIEADQPPAHLTKGVFAGGDIVTGSATVILAMGAGRRAAKSIHEYLTDWFLVKCEQMCAPLSSRCESERPLDGLGEMFYE